METTNELRGQRGSRKLQTGKTRLPQSEVQVFDLVSEKDATLSTTSSSPYSPGLSETEGYSPSSPASSVYHYSQPEIFSQSLSASYFCDCSLCSTSQENLDEDAAFFTEQQDFASDIAATSHMNAGGRNISHPFADLRSASRARYRERKIRSNKHGCCNSYACRKERQSTRRTEHKRSKRFIIKSAIRENQKYETCYTTGHFHETKHKVLEWDIHLPEEFDEYMENMEDDVIRYSILHHNASIFDHPNPSPDTSTGETFTQWAQRRINEMRAVKESRIIASKTPSPPTHKPAIWTTKSERGKKYNVYTGSPFTTTLPTKSSDALGHALLSNILTFSPYLTAYRRRMNLSPYRSIVGFDWFGEYAWAWHRNRSGCWELGYQGCTGWPEVGGEPIPCPCCCVGSGSMYFECFCTEFGDEPSPEEGQRCALVEWVGSEGRRIVREEERKQRVKKAGGQGPDVEVDVTVGVDTEVGEMDDDAGWEVLSIGSGSQHSETWSVVDA